MKSLLISLYTAVFLIICTMPLSAGPLVEIDVGLYNVNTNQEDLDGNITWSNFDPDDPKWEAADQYLIVHYAIIQEEGDPANPLDDVWYNGWGLQICTDNTVLDAEYQYTGTYAADPNPNGAPDAGSLAGDFAAGLVHESGKYKIPMCWRVIAPKRFMSPGEPGYDPNLDKNVNLQIYETEDHHLRRSPEENYNCWIWLKDRANDGWSDPIHWGNSYFANPAIKWQDGMLYGTVVGPNGIQHAEMSFDGWGTGPLAGENGSLYGVYIYLGADFSKAAGGSYKTNKLYLQLYRE